MAQPNVAWEYDGVDLTTFAYDVRALGAPESVPARRGTNLIIPGRTGRVHVAKVLDERELSLVFQVNGKHPSTGAASTPAQLWSNLNTLKALFARDGQRTLKMQNPTNTLQATVSVDGLITFDAGGPRHYDFVVQFTVASGFWESESATQVGPTVITQSPQNITVDNDGGYVMEKATITCQGPLTNPKFTVGSVWVQYTGAVALGEELIINIDTFIATLDGVDRTGNISHDGKLVYLVFPVGSNTMAVNSSAFNSVNSSVQVDFTEVFL